MFHWKYCYDFPSWQKHTIEFIRCTDIVQPIADFESEHLPNILEANGLESKSNRIEEMFLTLSMVVNS